MMGGISASLASRWALDNVVKDPGVGWRSEDGARRTDTAARCPAQLAVPKQSNPATGNETQHEVDRAQPRDNKAGMAGKELLHRLRKPAQAARKNSEK